ncbi:hypothetical protein L210DRAFT_3545736 [Boletus edulis BED1]|uniref:Uncharacterized protein n=1 Tax=Boletus edulis BED1 TaxID=1328754 RepID=A0AAD4BQ96_BOLED|nr:hypothetical protein L210DRAFT_3591720 [Boletus edulis BED1]KAF8437466.1 hypothetical protein L210DRAFT_3545736 [Boletus edulis BED1]
MESQVELDGGAQAFPNCCKPHISVYRQLAERSWMDDMAKVLVQEFCEEAQVPCMYCPMKLLDEFCLRRGVAF